MATAHSVWGVVIGSRGITALRCRAVADERVLHADVFEHIVYPQDHSHAGAEPTATVRGAVEELLRRHDLGGHAVAVSLPSRRVLIKWMRLPPIENRQIADVVSHEMRMQVPFPLDEVVWRWQVLPGYLEESGYLLNAEVLLAAARRDDLQIAIAPLKEAGVNVSMLQADTIALANAAIHDHVTHPVPCVPDDAPPAVALVAMEDDRTDIVMTNGRQVSVGTWPGGGSVFADVIRRARQRGEPESQEVERIIAANGNPAEGEEVMPTVFADWGDGLQQVFDYWSKQRDMELEKIVLLGEGSGLPLLPEYLKSRLRMEVQQLEKFSYLDFNDVVPASTWRELSLSSGIAYGLALQAASKSVVSTNLMPDEGI